MGIQSGETRFHGWELRRVRGHYFHLRRRLGEKKLLKVVKRIGAKESRIVNDQMHKIAKTIVDEAELALPVFLALFIGAVELSPLIGRHLL